MHGPFAVGYKAVVIGAGTAHPLEGSLWYPALNPTGRKEEITYAIKLRDLVDRLIIQCLPMDTLS